LLIHPCVILRESCTLSCSWTRPVSKKGPIYSFLFQERMQFPSSLSNLQIHILMANPASSFMTYHAGSIWIHWSATFRKQLAIKRVNLSQTACNQEGQPFPRQLHDTCTLEEYPLNQFLESQISPWHHVQHIPF